MNRDAFFFGAILVIGLATGAALGLALNDGQPAEPTADESDAVGDVILPEPTSTPEPDSEDRAEFDAESNGSPGMEPSISDVMVTCSEVEADRITRCNWDISITGEYDIAYTVGTSSQIGFPIRPDNQTIIGSDWLYEYRNDTTEVRHVYVADTSSSGVDEIRYLGSVEFNKNSEYRIINSKPCDVFMGSGYRIACADSGSDSR